MKRVWGLRERLLLGAAAVLVGGSATPVAAADLGGDCCADLEERVAELEATTARKGNRKVSLTISGWVNEAVFWWDDGSERNVYVGTNNVEQTRVRFTGEAKITADWSAGYILELGTASPPSQQWDQTTDQSTNANPANQSGIIIRKSAWFVKNKDLGQVSVGQNGTATYHLLDDADFTLTRNVDDGEGAPILLSRFFLRSGGAPVTVGTTNLRWTDALRGFNNSTPGDSGRRSVVRYDSPVFAGFSVAAAWGEDDLWDVAVIYKNDIGDFSVAGRAGYGQSNDPGTNNPSTGTSAYVTGGSACISGTSNASSLPNFECSWGGVSATILHKPTGLFVFGGWGQQHISTDNTASATQFALGDPDSTVWYVQPGIERKWLPFGKTNIFGEYRQDDAGTNPGRTLGASIHSWQGGVIQNIEAADTSIYLVYQHTDGDVTLTGGAKKELDAFQEVVGGLKINF